MKTPREIMLDEHREADQELARIQEHVLATGLRTPIQPTPVPAKESAYHFIFRILWGEIIQPARRIWVGYAVVWAVIAAVNLTQRDASVPHITAKPISANVVMTWQEQQKLLSELADPVRTPVMYQPKPVTTKPRSDRQSVRFIG